MLHRLRTWLRPLRSADPLRRRPSVLPVLELLEDRCAPAVLTVTSLADTTTAGNALTLREAIMVVDGTLGRSLTAGEQASISGTLGNNDTIQFNLPSGPQTITLTGGELSITNPVAIVGPGAAGLTINGNGIDRVFYVGSSFSQNLGLVVSISGLTIAGGTQQYGAGLFSSATLTVSNTSFSNNTATNNGGGGIYNNGALTLNGCTFTGNSTVAGTDGATAGGALLSISSGTATLTNCTFTGNTAPGTGATAGSGGAIANDGQITMTGCTYTGNSVGSDGGAFYNDGAATMSLCSFTNNSAGSDGGALHCAGTLTISTSLIAGNSASSNGGGMEWSSGTQLTVSNSTFANNTAGTFGGALINWGGNAAFTNVTMTGNRAINGSSGTYGGGIWVSTPLLLQNCIVAGNFAGSGTTPDDIDANIVDSTSADNIIGVAGSSGLTNGVDGNQVGVANAGLGTLANNGGPTQTIALLPGSPAIDSGNNNFVAAGATDQRGLTRIINGTVDIGAFEVQAAAAPSASSLAISGFPTSVQAGTAATITITALTSTGSVATGYTGTVHFTSSDLQAVLPANYTFTAADNGTHAFSITLKTAGAQSITVADTVTTALSATDSVITVTPAAAGILTLTGLPTSIAAGAAGSFTVTARDAFGNVASGYTGTVHFSSSDAQAILPANYTFTAADSGTHTFAFALKTAGTQSITVADMANASLSATGPATTVTPAAASTLTLTGLPASITAGTAASFTVTARDAFGNIASGYTGSVHFTSSDTQAILPANYTFTAADSGTHTFGVTFETAGTQSLTATDTVTASITGTSGLITVNPAPSNRAVLLVNSTADTTTADNFLTLREAVEIVDGTLGRPLTPGEQAQVTGTLGSNVTIAFNLPAGAQTITLTGGALDITKPATITGPGAGSLTISGNNRDRVFIVGQVWSRNLSLAVAISGLTVAGGKQSYGAGLLNFGTLTVANATFANNVAGSSGGGGLYNVGAVTLNACTFTGNTVAGSTAGGGIDSLSSGTMTITGCTFTGNTAGGSGSSASSGGGIASSGTMNISGSTFSGNVAASDGGAIYNNGSMTIGTSSFLKNTCYADGGAIRSGGTLLAINASTFAGNDATSVGGAIDTSDTTFRAINCTFAGNTAGSLGAAIMADSGSGSATLTNCTITANTVTSSSSSVGGGLYAGRAIILDNTIVAGNFHGASNTPDDIAGTVNPTSAFNLIGIGGAGSLVNGVAGNLVGVANPGLGSLANNGGPTLTVALLAGSPAIDSGSNTFVSAGETDQRGLARIVNNTVDIGAFEVQLSGQVTTSTLASPSSSLTSTSSPSGSTITFPGSEKHHHGPRH